MNSRIICKRVSVCVLVAAGLVFLGAAAFSAVPKSQAPDPNPSGPVVSWVGNLTITPPAPPVGSYYTVTGMIHSRHHRPLLIRATIMPPPMDRPSEAALTRRIEANSDLGLMWTVYCGEPGGTVNVRVEIVQEL